MIQSVYSPTFTIVSYQLARDWGSRWRGVHRFAITEILVNVVGQRDKAQFMPRLFVEDQSSNKLIPHIPSSYSCGCMIDNAPDIMEVGCTISSNHWKPVAVLSSAEMEAFSCWIWYYQWIHGRNGKHPRNDPFDVLQEKAPNNWSHGSVPDESTAGHCTMSGQLYWWTVVYGVDLMPAEYLSTGIIEDYQQKMYWIIPVLGVPRHQGDTTKLQFPPPPKSLLVYR